MIVKDEGVSEQAKGATKQVKEWLVREVGDRPGVRGQTLTFF